jgi:carbon-monoxide dehydrogenase medium subunit
MAGLDYVAPSTIDEAVAVLGKHGASARVLAGGTDIIIQVRERRRDVAVMVDAKHIPELMSLQPTPEGGLRIGAAVSCQTLRTNDDLRDGYPAICDSAELIGGIQIQSRASLGGNLCNSSPAADSIPSLIALGAICEIAGPGGRRSVPVEQFCTGPGQNVLQPGEMLVALVLPPPPANGGAAFERFIPRNEMDIAVANAAAAVTLSPDGSRFERARVAVGAVAPTPLLVDAAGAALAGQPVSQESIDKAVEAVRAATRPITDMRGSVAQRRHLAGVLTARVINKAVERARRP